MRMGQCETVSWEMEQVQFHLLLVSCLTISLCSACPAHILPYPKLASLHLRLPLPPPPLPHHHHSPFPTISPPASIPPPPSSCTFGLPTHCHLPKHFALPAFHFRTTCPTPAFFCMLFCPLPPLMPLSSPMHAALLYHCFLLPPPAVGWVFWAGGPLPHHAFCLVLLLTSGLSLHFPHLPDSCHARTHG